ncbi:MAG: TfoX/Sxy family protein [Chloroflexi bacterium]|nr:TfoX/Sxy family protein [Chloroflexota bacterium]
MPDGKKAYEELRDMLVITEQVTPRQMFGSPNLMANGYAFAALYHDDLIVKLKPDDLAEAMALTEVKGFDPMETGKVMTGWVQIPPQHAEQWERFARAALEYIREMPPKKPRKKAAKPRKQ